MIGLDTNVLVRYVAQDDAKQSLQATRLIEALTVEAPGFISAVTVAELVWVLTGCYGSTKTEICAVLEALLRTKELVVDQAETVWKALKMFRGSGGDFADCLIERSGSVVGCEHTVTFDKGAARNCGMHLVG